MIPFPERCYGRNVIEVARAVAITPQDEILLGRAVPSINYTGRENHYELLGGKLEGDDPVQAAIREINEETGGAQLFDPIYIGVVPYTIQPHTREGRFAGMIIVQHVIRGVLQGKVAPSGEHSELILAPLNKVSQIPLRPGTEIALNWAS